MQSLDDVTLEYDRNRWETQRREFEARRIRDPRLVDGMLDHPDTRKVCPAYVCARTHNFVAPDAKLAAVELLEEAAQNQSRLALTKAIIEAHELMLDQCVLF